VEGEWSRGKGVAILSFDTYKEAQRWKDSVPEIRQPDWLDGVDLIIVPVNEMPRTSCFALFCNTSASYGKYLSTFVFKKQ